MAAGKLEEAVREKYCLKLTQCQSMIVWEIYWTGILCTLLKSGESTGPN